MTNKVLTGILVLLVVLSGALGTYAYNLSQQINALSGQLVAFQDEFTTFRDESMTFREESITGLGILEKGVSGTLTRIDTLDAKISGTLTRIDTLDDKTSNTLSRIGRLDNEIKNVAARIAESGIKADRIYQRASQAIVRITDGDEVVGTGFIFDAAAHVMTAYHVVEQLPEIDIILADGSISTATIIGSSIYSDIAVLRLEEPPVIIPLTLADSATVRIGEPVVTIGNPMALTQTLTAGIVSQTNRYVEIEYTAQSRWVANLIQFDAPVNSGNSGGPLLNAKGEVIGMVVARVNPLEGDGIYYAVSSNKLQRVATALISQGSFDYPRLGISIANLTPQVAQSQGLETINGVRVGQVAAGSPAAAAGVKANDIIVAIDGITIRDVADLTSYLGENKSPDDIAQLTIIRDNSELELSLKVGKLSP